MPELPEVENVVRTMRPYLAGKIITDVVHIADHLSVLPYGFSASGTWLGKKVAVIDRHGKYIKLMFTDNTAYVIHLRMTGKIFFRDEPDPGKHIHFIAKTDEGRFLHFSDVRKFARFVYVADSSEIDSFVAGGPDALTISSSWLESAQKRWPERKIKVFLLDQKQIAGVGNIYADEICHLCGIAPDAPLKNADPGKLASAVRTILEKAIKLNGTTLRDYQNADGQYGGFQNTLKVYGRDVCGSCGTKTVKIKLGGRTTRFCPKCQD